MIVQCPSCKSRFSVNSEKINSPLTNGRCSVCHHVFPLLDHAVDEREAAEIRDRLEEERAKRAKETLGDVAGVYGVTGEEGSKGTGSEAEVEPEGFAQQDAFFKEPIEKGLERSEDEIGFSSDFKEERFGEEKDELTGEELGEKSDEIMPEWEPTAFEEDLGKEELETVEELGEEEIEVEKETGEEGEEESLETLEPAESGHGEEFEIEAAGEGEEVSEWPPAGTLLEEETEESGEKDEGIAEAEEGTETREEDLGLSKEESLVFRQQEEKRSSLPLVLIIILVILALAAGGWYLLRSGGLSSFTQKIMEKVGMLRGQTGLMLFDLKNEQEPAVDGKFFAVRGMVQNKKKSSFPYVVLRIKIYDAKNNVILTKQTIAGRILKPGEISKMTVQDALKQYTVMNQMNKKSSGKLGPNQKLPFLFLFDLSKFPRKKAKTFQVEILKLSK